MTQYVLDRPALVQNAVLFTAAYDWTEVLQTAIDKLHMGGIIKPGAVYDSGDYLNKTIPHDLGYSLWYNGTVSQFPMGGDNYALGVKRAIDTAAFELRLEDRGSNTTHVDLRASWSKLPQPANRIHGYDVVAQDGGVWFYVPPMITFFILLSEIVNEKESRLRLGMRMMGMRLSPFWVSWYMTGIAFTAASSLLVIL